MADVRIHGSVARGDRRTVGFWLTDEPPVPSGGYGGYEVVSRPHRAGLVNWRGRDPFTLTLPLLLHSGGDSVADDIHVLEILASGDSGGGPPPVTIEGAVMIPDHAAATWVINDLAWGAQRRREDAVITFQLVTLTLLEVVTDESLRTSTTRARTGGKTVVRHYTVKPKDTLQSIAARELGDAKRWVDLATANGLRTSKQLKRGMVLKLP